MLSVSERRLHPLQVPSQAHSQNLRVILLLGWEASGLLGMYVISHCQLFVVMCLNLILCIVEYCASAHNSVSARPPT